MSMDYQSKYTITNIDHMSVDEIIENQDAISFYGVLYRSETKSLKFDDEASYDKLLDNAPRFLTALIPFGKVKFSEEFFTKHVNRLNWRSVGLKCREYTGRVLSDSFIIDNIDKVYPIFYNMNIEGYSIDLIKFINDYRTKI